MAEQLLVKVSQQIIPTGWQMDHEQNQNHQETWAGFSFCAMVSVIIPTGWQMHLELFHELRLVRITRKLLLFFSPCAMVSVLPV